MGWTVDVLWAAARVSWGFPHIWSDRRRSRFRGSAFHRRCCLPRLPDCGGPQTSAGMPSAASRMGVGVLPGAFPGKGDRDCRKPGEIADLTLSSGRGPGRVSPQVSITSWKCAKNQGVLPNAQNQVGVDPAVTPPCAHRARSHEARRPWPMLAGWPYTDQQPKLPNGPCSSSRLAV